MAMLRVTGARARAAAQLSGNQNCAFVTWVDGGRGNAAGDDRVLHSLVFSLVPGIFTKDSVWETIAGREAFVVAFGDDYEKVLQEATDILAAENPGTFPDIHTIGLDFDKLPPGFSFWFDEGALKAAKEEDRRNLKELGPLNHMIKFLEIELAVGWECVSEDEEPVEP